MNNDQSAQLEFSKELLLAFSKKDYGQVVTVKSMDSDNERTEELEVNFKVSEIPQYSVVSVKKIENIRITVTNNEIPTVYCRNDFPIVPHLNLNSNGQKSLCLFDATFRDIKYMFNASMFLDRINWWFSKTSRGELHQENQPLEPFFPSVKDKLILELETPDVPLIRLCDTKNSEIILKEVPLREKDKGELYILAKVNIGKIYSDNIINKQPRSLSDLNDAFNDDIVKEIESLIQPIWNIRQDDKLYNFFFNRSQKALKNCKILLLVLVSLAREQKGEVERCEIKAFVLNANFQELFKSFGYEIQKSKIVKSTQNNDYLKIGLKQLEILFALEQERAQIFNGVKKFDCTKSIFQIGVGTLGSQILNNCFRAGYGNWTILDSDTFYPHNIARHSLTSEYVGLNKAEAMLLYAKNIIKTFPDNNIQIIKENIFCEAQSEKFCEIIEKSSLVVDTSASIAVQRYLCNELSISTRCVSFFMNPTGTSLVMLLENRDKTIILNDLEMQYYKMLLHNKKFKNHLKMQEKIIYSTSCRSKSAKISQDNVAIFSGLCSKVIKAISDTPEAHIAIWSIIDFGLENTIIKAESFESYKVHDWRLKISVSLKNRLYDLRKEKLPCETGGILIGSYDHEHKVCYVVDIISSPSDSEEYPNAYIRGSNGLLEQINKIEEITSGNLEYIGEWHSHPNNNTSQSMDDGVLIRSIAEYNYQRSCPGCMIIVGNDHISPYLQFI